MNMNEIFSTRERVYILENIIYSTKEASVNTLARRLNLSKGLISKYFEILIKEDILEKFNSKFRVKDSAIVKGIKIMLNIKKIDNRLLRKYKFIEAAGLYGSCAKGENFEDSDVDLWIKIKNAMEQEIVHLSSVIHKKIKNSKVLYLTDEKLTQLKKENPAFYYSLNFGSILIYGRKDAI